jgi:hypothetical protein
MQVIDSAQQSAEQERTAARAIWDELEAEESGAGQPPPEAPEAQPAPSTTEPQPEAGQPAAEAPPEKIAGSPLSDEERALLRQIPEVVQLVRSTVGRVGSLQSELAKLGKQAAAATGAGAAPTATAIDKAAASPEKWEALKKDFPDWAEGVESYVSTRIPSAPQQPAFDPNEIRKQIASEFESKRQEDAMEVVALFDSKWREKAGSQEFKAWLDAQPPEYRQRALSTWKPSEILSTVRAFDAAHKQPPAKPAPNPRLRGATIPSGTSRVNLTKPVDEMTPQEYWAYLDAQETRQQRA